MKKLKDKVLEIASIAQECPEKFQQICFEVLLKHALTGSTQPPPTPELEADTNSKVQKKEPKSVVEQSSQTQDDILLTDLHIKVQRVLEKQGVTIGHINQLFYKEDANILPLFDNIKTTKTSESQIRITLIQCFLNAIQSGNFSASLEAVQEEANNRKCYDSKNWVNNFTNNSALFDFGEKFTRKITTISLSDHGKTKLADLIKELQ
ncbi:MAG: hypothetical protein JRF25_10100 [Deltaproteobacteria bacterium]|nr:hypothetical protein [Deltaproteobacteria bacterium]